MLYYDVRCYCGYLFFREKWHAYIINGSTRQIKWVWVERREILEIKKLKINLFEKQYWILCCITTRDKSNSEQDTTFPQHVAENKMRLPLQLQIIWKCTVNWSVKFICAAAIHPSIKITYQSRNRQGESNTVMWCAWWDEMPFYNNNTHAYKWINPNNSISMVGLNEKESFLCDMFYCVSKNPLHTSS